MTALLFRDYTFHWAQVSLFKIFMLVIGLYIGARWADFWLSITNILLVVFVVLLVYFVHQMYVVKNI